MGHRTRALALLALVVPLAMGCARATRDPRMSEAAASPPTLLAPAAPVGPPVTASGVVASYNAATGVVSFEDGRMVRLTRQSRILQTGITPGLRPGAHVVVQNAAPVVDPAEPTRP